MDEWEVGDEQVLLQEEIGEGAFGKVYKGSLKVLPDPAKKVTLSRSVYRKSVRNLSQKEEEVTVAVKMLHSE